MKTMLSTILLCGCCFALKAQSIIGKWQLVKQSSCLEENIMATSDQEANLTEDMKSMSAAAPQVVTFKEKLSGEESTRILTKKKTKNKKTFLYKFDGETLLILDKKSQTITDNYRVNKFSADSLIISNAARPCNTKIFVRLE